MDLHPITAASFALIDQEIGAHAWSEQEYAIVRRAIHATADFELKDLFHFSPGAIAAGLKALRSGTPVIVDVRMVAVAVATALTYCHSPLFCAIEQNHPEDGLSPATTRTAAGLLPLIRQFPQGIYVIGNAPTALLTLVDQIRLAQADPALVIGVPVGFVAVEQAKQSLADLTIPQIQVKGRKGGSPVAAAIVNALVHLALT
jgi:precorrin-8X/cobalt-precorrin-8 methylmutase